MTETAQHIQYLLRYHDCVILPGIGAFMKSYRKAELQADGTIQPPIIEYNFNAYIASNDGLLAHSIMRRSGLTFEESRAKVAAQVERMKSALHSDGEITFGKIGILSMGEDNNISFIPFTTSLSTTLKEVRKDINSTTCSAKESDIETISKRFNTARNYYIAINKRFAKVAAVVTFVLAAASTYVVPSLQTQRITGIQKASVLPLSEINVNKSKTVDYKPIDTVEAVTDNTTDSQYTTENTNYLIVGTFGSEEECNNFIASQESETTETLKVLKGKRHCRVYVAASQNRENLLEKMRDKKFSKLYPQSWIWTP